VSYSNVEYVSGFRIDTFLVIGNALKHAPLSPSESTVATAGETQLSGGIQANPEYNSELTHRT
jgi:hypothetical protein